MSSVVGSLLHIQPETEHLAPLNFEAEAFRASGFLHTLRIGAEEPRILRTARYRCARLCSIIGGGCGMASAYVLATRAGVRRAR